MFHKVFLKRCFIVFRYICSVFHILSYGTKNDHIRCGPR